MWGTRRGCEEKRWEMEIEGEERRPRGRGGGGVQGPEHLQAYGRAEAQPFGGGRKAQPRVNPESGQSHRSEQRLRTA